MVKEVSTAKKWKIGPPASRFGKFFKTHKQFEKDIPEFKQDVTTDPYWHSTPKKIAKLREERHYPHGSYRWRKRQLRIFYLPIKEKWTIYLLDAATAGNIKYKK